MSENMLSTLAILTVLTISLSPLLAPAAQAATTAPSLEAPCVDIGLIGIGCDADDRDNHEDSGDVDEREETGDGDRDNHEDRDDENAREGTPTATGRPTEIETDTKTPPTPPNEPTVQPIEPPSPTPTQMYDANAPIEETTKRETDRQRKTETAIANPTEKTIENPTEDPIAQAPTETPTQEPDSPSTPSNPSKPSKTSQTPTTVPTPTDTNTQTAVASGSAIQPTASGMDGTAPTQTETARTPTTSVTGITDNTRNTSTSRNTTTTVEETEIGTTTPTTTETTTQTTQQRSQKQTPINTSGLPIEENSNSRTPTQWLWMLLGGFGAIGASTVTIGIVVAQHGTLGSRIRAHARTKQYLDRLIDAARRYWFAIIGRVRDEEWVYSNNNRAQIYETVRMRPGETQANLVDETDISRGTVRHHLNLLAENEKLRDEKRYRHRRYFSGDRLDDTGRALVAALRNVAREPIIIVVRDADSRLPISDLADRLDRSQQTLSEQVAQLDDDNIVECEQVGQTKYVALTERASKLMQQQAIRQFCQ